MIDSLNHERQHELALEKNWIVKSADYAPWFRIDTTILGMTLVDAMEGTSFMIASDHYLKDVSTKVFAGHVVAQILKMDLSDSVQPTKNFLTVAAPVDEVNVPANPSPVSLLTEASLGATETVVGDITAIPPGAPGIPLHFRQQHPQVKLGRERRGDCRAKGCSGRSQFNCGNAACGKRYCNADVTRNGTRYCFYSHVAEQYIASGCADTVFETAFLQWKETQTYLK